MKVLALTLVLCLASIALAQSEGRKSEGKKAEVLKDQRGTERQPFVIKGFPAEPTQQDRESEQRHRDQQVSVVGEISSALRGIHQDGHVVMWLTGGLLLVAICQLWFFRRQLKVMADEFRQSKSELKLAREEFHASHRPKLAVRRPSFVDNPLGIHFAITNVGDVDAQIVTSEVRAFLQSKEAKMEPRPHYTHPPNNRIPDLKIAVGETEQLVAPIENCTDRSDVVAMERYPYRVVLVGYLVYKNKGGTRGYTAFCRVWDGRLQEFIKPESDERIAEYDRYEYTN